MRQKVSINSCNKWRLELIWYLKHLTDICQTDAPCHCWLDTSWWFGLCEVMFTGWCIISLIIHGKANHFSLLLVVWFDLSKPLPHNCAFFYYSKLYVRIHYQTCWHMTSEGTVYPWHVHLKHVLKLSSWWIVSVTIKDWNDEGELTTILVYITVKFFKTCM